MTSKNKKYKNLIIAFVLFMGFMWLCTVISKSIYVSRLPRVRTENPAKKYVEHRIETEGMVIEGAKAAITALDGIRVENIFVRAGDVVEEGRDLFRVDLEDMNELMEEKKLEIEKLQYQISDLETNKELKEQRKLLEEQRAREDYTHTDSNTGTVLERAENAKNQADNSLQEHLNNSVAITSDGDRQKAWDNYYNWIDEEKKLIDKIAEMEKIVTNLESPPAMDEGQTDSETTPVREKTEEEKAELEAAKEQLNALREALAAHERNRVAQPDFSGEDNAVQNFNSETKQLENNFKSAGYSKDDAETERAKALKEAERKVDDTLFPDNADSALNICSLEMEQLEEQLSKYQKIKEADGYVKAETGGMITDIYITVGGRIPDTAAMLMTDYTVPCQFKASIDKDKMKYVNWGDTMTLKLAQNKNSIEVKVDYLAESKTVPGVYELYSNLPEDMGIPGISGTLEETVKGEHYNCVIPAVALNKEDMKYYIYVLKEREGILGKEMYAEKVYVKVLDQNDEKAALEEGLLDEDSRIITSSSEVFQNGEVVRLED